MEKLAVEIKYAVCKGKFKVSLAYVQAKKALNLFLIVI